MTEQISSNVDYTRVHFILDCLIEMIDKAQKFDGAWNNLIDNTAKMIINDAYTFSNNDEEPIEREEYFETLYSIKMCLTSVFFEKKISEDDLVALYCISGKFAGLQ